MFTPSLDDVVEHLDRASRHGVYWKAVCPFHDDREPSLLVFHDHAYCLGACQRTYTLREVYQAVRHHQPLEVSRQSVSINWREALKNGLDSFVQESHQLLLDYPSQGEELVQRGVEHRIQPQKLGWYSGWFTLPVRDKTRTIVGVVARAGPALQKETGRRFDVPPGQPPYLYVPDWDLVEHHSYVFFVGGMFDALTLCEARLPVVAATRRGMAPNPDWFKGLRKRILCVPDRGEEEATRNFVYCLGVRGQYVPFRYPANFKDPNDFSRQHALPKLIKELVRYA